MPVIIIGKNGQVSSHLKNDIKDSIVIGSEELDISDEKALISRLKQYENISGKENYVIINAAAYTNVEKAEDERDLAYKINANAPKLLSKFCHDNNYLFIQYSTDYVFDGTKQGEYTEKDTPNPINYYGKTKLIGEEEILKSGSSHLILRTSWVFSEFGMNFVKKIRELILSREELNIISDQIGKPTYAGFISDITLKLIEFYKEKNTQEIINLSQESKTSWYGFAERIKKNLENEARVCASLKEISSEEYVTKAKRPLNSTLSNQKLYDIIGTDKLENWEISLQKVLKIIDG